MLKLDTPVVCKMECKCVMPFHETYFNTLVRDWLQRFKRYCPTHLKPIAYKTRECSCGKVLKASATTDGSPVDLIGREDDISLFKALDYPNQKTNYKFGNSDLLKLGDNVIVIGNSFMYGINLKKGFVSKLDMGLDYAIDCDLKHSFMVTAPANSGDSGSPLLAMQDGEYYLVGILHATLGEGMGYIFNVNYVKGALKRILDKSLSDAIFIDHETQIVIESGLDNP